MESCNDFRNKFQSPDSGTSEDYHRFHLKEMVSQEETFTADKTISINKQMV